VVSGEAIGSGPSWSINCAIKRTIKVAVSQQQQRQRQRQQFCKLATLSNWNDK